MANRLDGINPLAYRGVRATTPPQMIVENRAPTQNDLANRVLGTQWSWINESDPAISRQYMLASVEQNIAVWIALDSDDFVDLPDHSVALGTGAPGLNSTGPSATVGYVLASNGLNADPSFQAPEDLITLPDHSVAIGTGVPGLNSTGPIATLGAPLVSNGNAADPSFGVASVSGGGTGLNDCDPYAVYCGGITGEGPLQQVAGLGTTGQVLTSNGLGMLPTWQDIGAFGGGGVLVTVIDTPGSGNHDLNDETLAVTVIGFGAGAGGGSGRQGASGSAGGGGGGGNGGTFVFSNIPVASFGGGGASVPYTVGAGGAGGAAQTVNNTDGNDGSNGGLTLFGNIVIGGTGLEAEGGSGGTATVANGGVNSYCLNLNVPGMVMSGGGGSGNEVDGDDGVASQGSTMFPSSGGGGAGANSVTEYTGGGGANISSYQALGLTTVLAGGTGGVESISIDGGAGLDGDTATDYFCGGSGGGGGGGQQSGLIAGDGGNGGNPGGGGGGGGGSLNGTNSGAGGNGGDGALVIIEYLSGGAAPPPVSTFQINTIIYDTPGAGTYTPTTGMTQCVVECIGGGGGSAGIPEGYDGAVGGGGAGGYCKKTFDAATIGASQSYFVASGGAAGGLGIAQGGTGQNTTFGVFLGALGGVGSGVSPVGNEFWIGGPGGAASGGELNIPGQAGYNGGTYNFSGSAPVGGFGGSTLYGAGGRCTPNTGSFASSSQLGFAGTGYGSGAGGGMQNTQASAPPPLAGTNGSGGVIIITEYIS